MVYYAVYLCGCTDCFLTAVFTDMAEAEDYIKKNSKNPEGGVIIEWSSFADMDFTDTGFGFKVPEDGCGNCEG